jgi:hypothetical protein
VVVVVDLNSLDSSATTCFFPLPLSLHVVGLELCLDQSRVRWHIFRTLSFGGSVRCCRHLGIFVCEPRGSELLSQQLCCPRFRAGSGFARSNLAGSSRQRRSLLGWFLVISVEDAARPEKEGPVLLSDFTAMLVLLAFSARNLALSDSCCCVFCF